MYKQENHEKVSVQKKKTTKKCYCTKQENHQEKWVCKAKTKTKTPGENI